MIVAILSLVLVVGFWCYVWGRMDGRMAERRENNDRRFHHPSKEQIDEFNARRSTT